MFELRTVTSLDDPVLAPYRSMKDQHRHRDQRIFIAEGDKVVRRLLQSECEVVSLVLPSKWIPGLEELLRNRPEQLIVYVAEKDVLEQLTGYQYYQGVLAMGIVPREERLEEVLVRLAKGGGTRLILAADGVSNSQNLGTLLRTASAFGVEALVVGETSSSPYLRRAVRSSMGAVFRMPVVESTNLVETLEMLRARGVRCVAAHPHGDQRRLSEVDLTLDTCVVVGSEGEGIRRDILDRCDVLVGVPMANEVDSLNVGSAGAVFMYEAARQRGRV